MSHVEFSGITAITDCLIEYIGSGLTDREVAERLSSADTLARLGHLVTIEDVIVVTLRFGNGQPRDQFVDAVVKAIASPAGFNPDLEQCVGAFRRLCLERGSAKIDE